MPVTVVVGGQFGSEGKGKVAYYLAREKGAAAAVRVGSVNSGHTVIDPHGNPLIFRQLPTASIIPDVTCILPAGCYIDLEIFFKEIFVSGVEANRLLIDPNAVIITEEDRIEERKYLKDSIASTASGTGAAVIRRIGRSGNILFAKDEPRLQDFVRPTIPHMRAMLKSHQRILIEGTQGYGLSLLHSMYYPYVTSRDTTAAAFVSEAGLSPLDVDEVVLTIRSFPIRVGGNSGPLPNEIDWKNVTIESGADIPLIEYTSVTKKIRRVARFHPSVVREAICVNNPTEIVLNHLDYIDVECARCESLTHKASLFVRDVERLIDRQITYYGFGSASLISSAFVNSGVAKCLV